MGLIVCTRVLFLVRNFFLLINIRFGELGLRGARQGQGRLRGSKSGFLIVLSLDMLLTHVIRTKNPFG